MPISWVGFRKKISSACKRRRSIHSGSRVPGAPVEVWGSGNHCAMFREGYLEIIGLTDPEKYSSVKPMVERYEGLHIVAIGVAPPGTGGTVDAAREELLAKGVPVESYTTTLAGSEVWLAPWSSVATARTACGPTAGAFQANV